MYGKGEGKSIVLVTVDPCEMRAAILREGVLVGYFVERKGRRSIQGNIYVGRVVKVIPGIRAAFVDTGQGRAAFLPATQVMPEELLEAAAAGRPKEEHKGRKGRGEKKRRRGVGMIEESLREGDEVTVQVTAVPGDLKGPKVTTYISVAGHYLVFLPTLKGIGVSRKIERKDERRRLRKIGERLQETAGGGFIIRSSSEGASEEVISGEAKWLLGKWQQAQAATAGKKPPFLLLEEPPLPERILRDLRWEEIQEVVVDDLLTAAALKKYVQETGIGVVDKIKIWEKTTDLFSSMEVEEKVERAFARKVHLPSGGYIITDHAEALTAIDVNTGSYTGERDPLQTVLTTNLEAVREIAYLLRLRGIGGLIIVDLVDMEREDHKEMVYNELVKELKKDKAKVSVRRISDMGLIEMTREHKGPRIIDTLHEKCWYCDGTGSLLGRDTICAKILRSLIQAARANPNNITVTAHQSIVLRLESEFSQCIKDLEQKQGVKIKFDPRVDVHVEFFKISQEA